jgi:hypothetical protein
VIVYAIIDTRSSRRHPLGDAIETFIRREDAEKFIDEVGTTIPSLRATCGSRSGSWDDALLVLSRRPSPSRPIPARLHSMAQTRSSRCRGRRGWSSSSSSSAFQALSTAVLGLYVAQILMEVKPFFTSSTSSGSRPTVSSC